LNLAVEPDGRRTYPAKSPGKRKFVTLVNNVPCIPTHQKIPYVYHLMPRGLEQKARITARFLKRKLSEYEEIKSQINEIASEAEKDGSMDLLSDDTLKRLSSTH